MTDKKIPSVSIVGCGWLGKPLARVLTEQGHKVVATTQRAENISEITATGAKAELLAVPFAAGKISPQHLTVFNQQCLIIAIPPQIKQGRTDYPDKVRQLINTAEKSNVEQVILISSTAVYGGLAGEVDEQTPLDYTAAKVAILAEAEQAALAFNGQAVVLRLAGLVGPKRHPGRFLAMNRKLADREVAINLIHLDDVIGLLLAIITGNKNKHQTEPEITGIINGVNDIHLSKKDFYHQAAKALSMPIPSFSEQGVTMKNKVVLGDKAKQLLNYTMQKDDLVTWMKQAAHNDA